MRAVESIAAMVPVRGVARYGQFAANDRDYFEDRGSRDGGPLS
jgi:hypothetical protein